MGRSSEPYRPSKMGLAASDSELRLARYALQMSEHLTEGSESSFWPTAQALWPTPRATDGTKGGPGQRGSKGDLMLPSLVLWPTPSAVSYGSNKGGAAGRVGEKRASLDTLGKHWSTPTARDGSGRGPGQSNKVQGGPNLMTQVDQWSSPQSGRLDGTPPRGRSTVALNPEFVETLMGLPIGWTDCGFSETESYRSKPQQPSSSASRGS